MEPLRISTRFGIDPRDHKALKGIDFHLHGKNNRMDLKVTTHKGPHQKYTGIVKRELDKIYVRCGKNTGQRKIEVEKLQNRLDRVLRSLETKGAKMKDFKMGRFRPRR